MSSSLPFSQSLPPPADLRPPEAVRAVAKAVARRVAGVRLAAVVHVPQVAALGVGGRAMARALLLPLPVGPPIIAVQAERDLSRPLINPGLLHAELARPAIGNLAVRPFERIPKTTCR